MARPITMRYSNGEVTVIWKPDVCVHSGVCFRGLPQVFDPRRRPWIAIDAASTSEIVAQVERCPSGALSWERDESRNGGDDQREKSERTSRSSAPRKTTPASFTASTRPSRSS